LSFYLSSNNFLQYLGLSVLHDYTMSNYREQWNKMKEANSTNKIISPFYEDLSFFRGITK